MNSKVSSNFEMLWVILFHITIINILLVVSGIVDIFSSFWYMVLSLIILIAISLPSPSGELSWVINKSDNKKIDAKFLRNVQWIEIFGSLYIITLGGMYFLNFDNLPITSIPLVIAYLFYCYLWFMYFKKYHISFAEV